MALGLGVLGLAPATFWAMTPKELKAAIEGRTGLVGAMHPSRGDLTEMMARFPDT